jgi:homoserine dehydrogenase
VEAHTRVTTNMADGATDPELDMVVEVIGGAGADMQGLLLGCAARGVSVVTANKALLAEHLPLLKRAFTSRRRALGYEASVAGGIPIIHALQHSLLPDSVQRVQGILNGTSNYILSAMEGGRSFEQALREAQAAGFAEADPTADVGGHDARNKLVILTQLAFGLHVPPAEVRTVGITGIETFDVDVARASGYAIKHLGVSSLFDAKEGEAAAAAAAAAAAVAPGAPAAAPAPPRLQRRLLDMYVSPALVPLGSPLAATGGAGNLVQVDSAALGRSSYAGAGAGREPTANSVLADLVSIAKGTVSPRPFPRPPPARVGLSLRQSPALRRNTYVRGPPELINLLSVALWRQGRSFAPAATLLPGSSSGSAAAGAPSFRAFFVEASQRELDSLVARAARKVTPAASAQAALLEKTVVYPVLQ